MVADRAGEWWNDEELLLAALDRALHPVEDVPASFVRAAQDCYLWHGIDAELAALAYDSAVDVAALSHLRAESAPLRALTYETTDLTFELEVTSDGLAGQLIPPQAGELQLHLRDGQVTVIPATSHGYFRIRPIPNVPFRLCCRFDDGRVVSTDLIVL